MTSTIHATATASAAAITAVSRPGRTASVGNSVREVVSARIAAPVASSTGLVVAVDEDHLPVAHDADHDLPST